jgi:hypothetical protein
VGTLELRRTHNFVNTVIYELPWGPNKRWLNQGILANIIGGWQISNIFIAQSGTPLSITASGTLFNTPGNSAYSRPGRPENINGGLGPACSTSIRKRTPSRQCDAGQHEAQQRSEGPGFCELDSSLFKRFSVGEKRYAEIHVDAYNTTNSVRWGNPNTGFQRRDTGNTFGQIQGIATTAARERYASGAVRLLRRAHSKTNGGFRESEPPFF